jgi:hypothetical protein
MSAKAKGSIVLKIVIVVLVFVLFYILTAPPEIWSAQKKEIVQERRDMSAIVQAQKFYKSKTGKFTEDYDAILALIAEDTSLVERRELSEASSSLYLQLKEALNNDIFLNVNLLYGSYVDMVGDFVDPEKTSKLRKVKEGKEEEYAKLNATADSLYTMLKTYEANSLYASVYNVLTTTADLKEIADKVTDRKLSESLLDGKETSELLYSQLSAMDITSSVDFYENKIGPLVKDFQDQFFAIGLNNESPFAERTIGFQSQIMLAFSNLQEMNFEANLEAYKANVDKITDMYGEYLVKYRKLLDMNGKLFLSLEDSLLSEFSKNNLTSKIAPDLPYLVEFDTSATTIVVESPVLFAEAKEKSAEIVGNLKGLAIYNDMKSAFSLLDSLQPVIDENLANLRTIKYRQDRTKTNDIKVELKTLPAMLTNFKDRSIITLSSDFVKSVDQLESATRFSQIQESLKTIFSSMASFAHVVDSSDVDKMAELIDDLYNDAGKVDSMFAEVNFRRSNIQWNSLANTLKPVKNVFSGLPVKMKSEKEKYLSLEESINTVYEENSEGRTEYRGYIFEIAVTNPGFIKNEKLSWEEDEEKK